MLKDRLIKGALWNSISQFGSQGINFVITIILARLLSPKEFGLVGMVMVFTSFFGFFTEFGLTPSLIKRQDVDELDYNTGFWSTIVFAVVIYVIMFFSAPLIGSFYKNQDVVSLVRVLFLMFLFSPLSFIPETKQKKELRYDLIAKAEIVAVFFSGCIAISIAFMGGGVWSLIVQQILFVVVRGSSLCVFSHWRPACVFSWERFVGLFSFGTQFTFNNLLNFLVYDADPLLVGKFLGPTTLGLYSMAIRISRYPILKVQSIVGQMMLPAFAMIQEDNERLRRAIIKVTAICGLLVVPVLICIFFGIEAFVKGVIGNKWHDVVPLVRVIIIGLIATSFGYGDQSVLMTLNKIGLIIRMKIISGVFLILGGIWAINHFGVIGIATWLAILTFINVVYYKWIVFSIIGIRAKFFISNMKRVVMILVILFCSAWGFYFVARDRMSPLLYLICLNLLIIIIFVLGLIYYGCIDLKNKKLDWDKVLLG